MHEVALRSEDRPQSAIVLNKLPCLFNRNDLTEDTVHQKESGGLHRLRCLRLRLLLRLSLRIQLLKGAFAVNGFVVSAVQRAFRNALFPLFRGDHAHKALRRQDRRPLDNAGGAVLVEE